VELEMVPVSDAKVRLHELVSGAANRPILLLRRSRPEAVLVSYDRWVELRREIEDLNDRLALHRAKQTPPDMRLTHDRLKAELGLVGED
jgi:prevent-host-death family protein